MWKRDEAVKPDAGGIGTGPSAERCWSTAGCGGRTGPDLECRQ